MPQIRSFPILEQSDFPIGDTRRGRSFSQWVQQQRAEGREFTTTAIQGRALSPVRKRKSHINKEARLESWFDGLGDNASEMIDADLAPESPVDAIMGSFDSQVTQGCEIRPDA